MYSRYFLRNSSQYSLLLGFLFLPGQKTSVCGCATTIFSINFLRIVFEDPDKKETTVWKGSLELKEKTPEDNRSLLPSTFINLCYSHSLALWTKDLIMTWNHQHSITTNTANYKTLSTIKYLHASKRASRKWSGACAPRKLAALKIREARASHTHRGFPEFLISASAALSLDWYDESARVCKLGCLNFFKEARAETSMLFHSVWSDDAVMNSRVRKVFKQKQQLECDART